MILYASQFEVPDWTPRLAKLGILRPVRWNVEPGVSLNLDSRDLVSLNILRSRMWQPEVWDSLNGALPEGGVLLDVGAHIGYFSLKGAVKAGTKGRVVSFEPNPETLVQLHSNIEASGVTGIVTVEPIGNATVAFAGIVTPPVVIEMCEPRSVSASV